MIKMTAHHPLLVQGEARTEFETDELHARELEQAGLAVRAYSGESQAVTVQSADTGKASDVDQSEAQEVVPAPAVVSEPATPAAVAKPKKAK